MRYGSWKWVGEVILKVLEMDNQECDCDDIFVKVKVSVVRAESKKRQN